MLEVGIDEITFVLQLSSSYNYLLKYNEWIDVARRIIDIFCVKADIENSFGEEKILAKGLPKGYTYGYTYGEHDHYFAIAFHEFRRDMGVVVKFSAKSLDYYCYSTGKTVYELLQQIQDDLYTVRTSRVDIALDYIDEDVNINDIYDGYLENRLVILREMKSKKDGSIFNKIVGFQIRGFFNQCDINTIYFGSKQSSSFLRIYDKKYEQMSKKGTKYKEACSCKNWVRFEGVFRNEYAHNIGDELLKVNNDIDFGNLLACIMIQRYRFMDKDNAGNMTETFYVNLLLSNISNMSFILRANESRDNRLLDNILYLLGNSGTISTLYKIIKE